jgi:hypothetical protein
VRRHSVVVHPPPSDVSSFTASRGVTKRSAGPPPPNALKQVPSDRNVLASNQSLSGLSSITSKHRRHREELVRRLDVLDEEIAKERAEHALTQRRFHDTAQEVELLREIVAARFSTHSDLGTVATVADSHCVNASTERKCKDSTRDADVVSVSRSPTIMSTSSLYAQ